LFASLDEGRRQKCIEQHPPSLPQATGDHLAACHYARVVDVL
jgi:hypothetical protein